MPIDRPERDRLPSIPWISGPAFNPTYNIPGINVQSYIDQYFSLQWELALSQVQTNKPNRELLGATDITFSESSIKSDLTLLANNALTTTIDTTTFPDKARLTIKNERGFDVYLTRMQIKGNPVYISRNEGGQLLIDDLKHDDDIRKNGENIKKISNDYIFDATQCATIADYWYKKCGQKKHIYQVSIKGSAHWYEPGDRYSLTLGAAGTNEYISSTVEIIGVETSNDAATLGSTILTLREVMESWSKTTLYSARVVTGSSPKRRSQQANIVIIGSSTYDGTCDYRCDGTADDVQIQAAIDYMSQTHGGGTIQLTAGNFIAAATIILENNVVLKGYGAQTVIQPATTSVTTVIDFNTATSAMISDFCIDGNNGSLTFTTDLTYIIYGRNLGKAANITIKNYAFSCTSGDKGFCGFYGLKAAYACEFISNSVANTGTQAILYGFLYLLNGTSCICANNSATGINGFVSGFNFSNNISSSSVNNNTSAYGVTGFGSCKSISACSVFSNSSTGANGNVAGFYDCSGVSSCLSQLNTATQTGAHIYSYLECVSLAVCRTYNNASTLGNEYGFNTCNSVQQCKCVGDSNPYTASYADSGTANPCADTAAGGYNS